MRLKTKLALAIGGLVIVGAAALSSVFLTQLVKHRIDLTYRSAPLIAQQLLFATRTAIQSGVPKNTVDVNDPAAVRAAVAQALRKDEALNSLINSIISYATTVSD